MPDEVFTTRVEFEDAASKEAAKLDRVIQKLTADYEALSRAVNKASGFHQASAINSAITSTSSKLEKLAVKRLALEERVQQRSARIAAANKHAQDAWNTAEAQHVRNVGHAWNQRGQAVDRYVRKLGLSKMGAGMAWGMKPGYTTDATGRFHGPPTGASGGRPFASAANAMGFMRMPGYNTLGERFAMMGSGAQKNIAKLKQGYANLRTTMKAPPPAFIAGFRSVDGWAKKAGSGILSFNQNIGKLYSRVTSAIPGFHHLASAFGVVWRSAVRIAFWGGITLTTAAITLSTKAAISAAAAYESASKSFETMLGSVKKAKELMDWSKIFAKTTPLQWPEVIEGARLQTAFGLDPRRYMKIAGDISAAMGAGQEGMRMVTTALGRIKAGQWGPAARELMRFGIGKERLEGVGLKFDKKGSPIGSPEEILAAVEAVAKLPPYVGQMKVRMTTLEGMWSNLKDQVWLIALGIGQHMTPGLKRFMERLKTGLENFTNSEAYKKLLTWLDNMFSDQSIDAAIKRLIHMVAFCQTAGEEIVHGFQVAKDFFDTGLITDAASRSFLAKLLGWMHIALKLTAVFYGVEAAIWGIAIAASHGTDAVAWVGALRAGAKAAAAGIGAEVVGKQAEELRLPPNAYYDKRINEINREIDRSKAAKSGLREKAPSKWEKFFDILDDPKAAGRKARSGGYDDPKVARKNLDKEIESLRVERAAVRQQKAAETAGIGHAAGRPPFGERWASNEQGLTDMFDGSKGKSFQEKFGIPDSGMKNLFGDTFVPFENALDDNTDAQNRLANELEGIVSRIIGGGDLAQLGIAPVEVARMKGYTDPVGRGGAGGGSSVTVNLPPGTPEKLAGFIRDTVEAVVQQMLTGGKSYSTARTGG